MTALADDRLTAVVRDHAASLHRLALRHSICADDAQDAYQRALVIYLERRGAVRDDTAAAWLRTVTKHEAMRIRAARQRTLPPEAVDWDEHPSLDATQPDERAAARERVGQVREALRACKPDERRAILLKADGHSYAEIAGLTGFTHTKVNRLLAEGRQTLHRRIASIEAGDACAAHRLTLSAIVDGESSVDDFVALRPHLRHCGACRAALRDTYRSERAVRAVSEQ